MTALGWYSGPQSRYTAYVLRDDCREKSIWGIQYESLSLDHSNMLPGYSQTQRMTTLTALVLVYHDPRLDSLAFEERGFLNYQPHRKMVIIHWRCSVYHVGDWLRTCRLVTHRREAAGLWRFSSLSSFLGFPSRPFTTDMHIIFFQQFRYRVTILRWQKYELTFAAEMEQRPDSRRATTLVWQRSSKF